MTSSHQGGKMAEAFWRCLSLKEVYFSLCLFVFIRGSSLLTIGRFFSNDPQGRAVERLDAYLRVQASTRIGRAQHWFVSGVVAGKQRR